MATAKTNTVAAKPPVVTPSAAPSASPLRQKKLGRQVPVKKIQHDSPSRIRRTKSEARKPALSGKTIFVLIESLSLEKHCLRKGIIFSENLGFKICSVTLNMFVKDINFYDQTISLGL